MKAILYSVLFLSFYFQSAGQWQQLNSPTFKDIVSSSFISDSEGWIGIVNVSSNAKFFHTTDSGETWESGTINGGQGGSTFLEFVSSTTGFAVANGEAFKTTDGGDSWVEMEMPATSYSEPFFIDESTGYISGSGKIFKTTNGGDTWISYNTGAGILSDLFFYDESTGAGCEYDGYVYWTNDGGQTWDWGDFGLWTTSFSVCYDLSGSLHWTSLEDVFGDYAVYFSSFYADDLDNELYDCNYFDDERGYAVGQYGIIISTIDGGDTWNTEFLTSANFNKIDGKNLAYVFGDEGKAYRLSTSCILNSSFSFTQGGLEIQFTDETSTAGHWFWDFGDGTTSDEQNPVHIYPDDGLFTVCHSAGNDSCGSLYYCQSVPVCDNANNSLNYAGTLDTTFDNDGMAVADFDQYYDASKSIGIQSDHKILASCDEYGATAGGLIRLNYAGTPDSSFAVDGILKLEDDLPLHRILVLDDDRFLVAGLDDDSVVVGRFTSEGIPDPSFGINGRSAVDPSPQNTYYDVLSMIIQPDGKIVLSSSYYYNSNYHGFAIRLMPDGIPDDTFGENGIAALPFDDFTMNYGGGMDIQSDGKILLTGSVYDDGFDIGVVRLLTDGTVDLSFGVDGRVLFDAGDYYDTPTDIEVQSDDKIVVIGDGPSAGVVIRYYTDGSTDLNFGSEENGSVILSESQSQAQALEIQSDGKILITGYIYIDNTVNKVSLVRLTTEGVFDDSFGTGGFVTTRIDCNKNTGLSLALDNDKIYVGGSYEVDFNTDICVLRYLNGCPTNTVNFSAGAEELTLNFIDQSSEANSWSWNFGDGNSSSEQNPSHTYAEEGTYDVCLTITDSCGSNSTCQSLTVCEALNTDYIFSQNETEVHFSNLVTTADSFYWDFGDGITSTTANPDHEYSLPGTYNACLYEFDICGDADTMCKELLVDYPLTNASVSSTDFLWNVYPNLFSNSTTIKFTLNESSQVSIKLFSLDGKELMTVAEKYFPAGQNQIGFKSESLPQGVYFLKMKTASNSVSSRIIKQ